MRGRRHREPSTEPSTALPSRWSPPSPLQYLQLESQATGLGVGSLPKYCATVHHNGTVLGKTVSPFRQHACLAQVVQVARTLHKAGDACKPRNGQRHGFEGQWTPQEGTTLANHLAHQNMALNPNPKPFQVGLGLLGFVWPPSRRI